MAWEKCPGCCTRLTLEETWEKHRASRSCGKIAIRNRIFWNALSDKGCIACGDRAVWSSDLDAHLGTESCKANSFTVVDFYSPSMVEELREMAYQTWQNHAREFEKAHGDIGAKKIQHLEEHRSLLKEMLIDEIRWHNGTKLIAITAVIVAIFLLIAWLTGTSHPVAR